MINEKLCRFYSPEWLSELLVDALSGLSPSTIVDLGSGPGSLSDVAAARWPAASVTTVDVDPAVARARRKTHPNHRHVRRNVLANGLARAVGVEPGTVDLVISNPPYTRALRSRSIDRVLAHASLHEPVAGWSMVPVDLVFLAQALLLARPGGVVAFVVPDTLISSEVLEAVRQIIVTQHHIEAVVQLPRRTFGKTDALAFILVIRKEGRGKTIKLSAVDDGGLVETELEVEAKEGIRRLDCLFHAASMPTANHKSLADLGVVVTRGRSNSRHAASANGTIFHTSDFPKQPGETVSLSGAPPRFELSDGIIAEPGDILLARVDRRLEQKVVLVGEGAAEISDCVIRLRVPEGSRERVLAGLISEGGRRQIIATSRGTGARHISYKAVLAIRV